MFKMAPRLAFLAAILAAWQPANADPAGHATSADPVQTAARQQTLVLGRVSDDPVKTIPRLREMGAYLAGQLAHLGISGNDVVVARNNNEMIAMLRAGEVDVVSETVMSAFQFSDATGAELLMREWKKGVASYRSVLFSTSDSDIEDIDDLAGRVMAFEDPGSTSGFLIPLAMLRERGIEAVELSSPNSRPPAGTVGYVFVGTEVNIAAWVARGIVDAGALNDTDWQDVDRTPGGLRESLRIFHESSEIPRSVLLVRGDLNRDLRDALQRTLADMESDPAAEMVLENYYRVARYDRFVGDVLRDLNDVRAQYQLIQDQFE